MVFSRFCHILDGISAFIWFFFPSWDEATRPHGLAGFIVWKCIVSLSFSLVCCWCTALFASISKILQKHPTQIQKKRTHESILPTFFLSRTIFTSLLVTLLPQEGVIFFQHPRAVIKTLSWMKLLPTEIGIMMLLLHCYYYLLCDLLLRWLLVTISKRLKWCLFHQLGDQTTKKQVGFTAGKKISPDRNPHLDPLFFF